MDFIAESFSYAASDGRIILRACIDRPLNTARASFEYLNEYSHSIRDFINDKLFLRAVEEYDISLRERTRFSPLLYTFKFTITYLDDLYLSCVMLATLVHVTHSIARSVDSIVFYDNKILPPRLINYAHRTKKLALDIEGYPCVVEYTDNNLTLRRVGKKSILKQ